MNGNVKKLNSMFARMMALALVAGPVAAQIDIDGDGLIDDVDNCTLVQNPTQLDADSDGYGNYCDADLNNTGLTTSSDFNLLRSVLNQSAASSALAAAADMNGSGTVTAADFNLLRARMNRVPGPSGLGCAGVIGCKRWTWRGGSNLVAPAGSYGTRGVGAPTNAPGGRNWNASWKDLSGNFWVFGGQGYDSAHSASALNDLWQYNPATGIWTWMSGSDTINANGVYGTRGVPSAANVPGAREFMVSWTDTAGNLLLFGGFGFDGTGALGYLNDLWRYNPNSGLWTWLAGPITPNSAGIYGTLGLEAATNWPGARYGSVAWTDAAGDVWLYGGYGVDANGIYLGYLNDLWRYNRINGRWTWMGGSRTCSCPGSPNAAIGVYGTMGTPAAANVPGGRGSAVAWTDAGGNLWLSSGYGFDSAGSLEYLNDLWQYNPGTGQWTWRKGSNLVGASGVYGTVGTPAPGNVPGARGGAVNWADTSGNLWLFGGGGYDSLGSPLNDLNDLWRYNIASGNWTWVNGSNIAAAPGVYGSLGTPSVATQPGARDSGTAWIDSNGHVWLFGGAGYDSAGVYDSYGLNDIFEYVP